MSLATRLLLSVLVPILLLASANQEPVPVLGLVKQTIELSAALPHPLPVQETVWKYTSGNMLVKVAEVGQRTFYAYSNQFRNRVNTQKNGTILVIKDLRPEDAGEYHAEIIFASKQIHRATFNLSVDEPIPLPTIWTEWKENTTDHCNITLGCSVQISDVTYIWKSRHRNSEYQLYDTGSTINLLLPQDHQDMEFLCTVQNRADQKNASVYIEQFCAVTNNAGMNVTQTRGCYLPLRFSLAAAFLCISMFSIHLSHRYQ